MRPSKTAQPGPFAVHLREIPREGLHRTYDLSGDWAAAALVQSGGRAETLTAEVDLVKVDDDVVANGRIAGSVVMPCSRCLVDAHVAIASEFHMTFLPEPPEEADGGEVEITAVAADTKTYAGEEIDLEETLREDLILAIPYAPLCRVACKGLCARCGTDLNEGACDCPPEPKDDRWAALKNVKL